MACRREDAAKEVAQIFKDFKGSYDILKLDLGDLSSVRSFADTFLKRYDRLNGIDGNAGVFVSGNDVRHTKDGLELHIGVSYFGHFLLTELLLDILKKAKDSRIVLLLSVVHAGNKKNGPAVDLSDLNYKIRKYNVLQAYPNSKDMKTAKKLVAMSYDIVCMK